MAMPHKSKKNIAIISAIALLLVVACSYLVYSFMPPKTTGNYAKDTARPLETALVDAGAVKVCETGDDGRGAANQRPWYSAVFELPSKRADAEKLISKSASDNGFNLIHASKGNKGPLNVDDQHIDNWYYDHSGHSINDNLVDGNIELNLSLRNNENIKLSHLSCGKSETVSVNNNDSITAVFLEVKLPEFKR